MLKVGCALALGLALAVPAGAATATRDEVAVSVTPAGAGARPVALTISWSAELQCGRLRAASIAITLPAAARVPARIPAAAVRVGGTAAAAVRVSGRTLTIALPRPTGMTCTVIAPGTVKVAVTAAARLGNPRTPGHYPLTVVAGGETLTGELVVR